MTSTMRSAHDPGDEQRAADLAQLQREYRNMELNRRAYAEESHSLMRKQQITLEKARKENDVLKAELAMEFRQFRKPADAGVSEKIHKLQEQGDHFARLVEQERSAIQVMEEQMLMMRNKTLHQRKMMGGVNAAKENEIMIQKQVRILENRLDKALTKFNEALSHNKTLRASIDDLRREKVVFENVHRKLEKEFMEKKKSMANIIELSNLSYEQRDNFQMEIAAIEQANRREQDDFDAQMLELSRVMEDDLNPSSSSQHNNTNTGVALSNGAGNRGGAAGDKTSGGGGGGGGGGGARGMSATQQRTLALGSTTCEEKQLKHKLNKGAWGLAKDKMELQVSIERIQNFEEAFSRIKSATGIDDIERLVRTFIKNEDHNFSLFNYVNEQQNEIEKLEELLQELRQEESKYANESGEDVHQHKQALSELEAKLHSTEVACEKYEGRSSDAAVTMEGLKDGVLLFLKMLSLSVDHEVTESNMLAYLGTIEERCNNLLSQYAAVKDARDRLQAAGGGAGAAAGGAPGTKMLTAGGEGAGEGGEQLPDTANLMLLGGAPTNGAASSSILGIGPKTPMGQELKHVKPPKLEDYSSDDDSASDDEAPRPLTRGELKARTLNKLQRKTAAASTQIGGGRSPKKLNGA